MNDDPFSDVRGTHFMGGFGSLNGEAIAQHFDVKVEATTHGRNLTVNCDRCGAPNVISIDWREIASFAAGVPPVGWRYDPNSRRIVPDIGCPSCRYPQTPSVTPDEAMRWLNAGIQSGVINRQAAEQAVAAARASGNAVRR